MCKMSDNFLDAQQTGKIVKDDVVNKNQTCHKKKKEQSEPVLCLETGKKLVTHDPIELEKPKPSSEENLRSLQH